MVNRLAAVVAACCLLATLPTAPATAAQRLGEPQKSAFGRYIVVLHQGASRTDVIADYRGLVAAGRRYSSVFSGFVGRMSPATAALLAADPRVDAVEADGRMHRTYAQGSPTWGLDRIDQPGRVLDRTYAYATRGRGVTAYIIDGGVYAAHREFGDRVDGGFDVTGKGARRDCDGHGTHVAGTVGGRRFGVAKLVRIVPVRVVDCSLYISRSDVIAGLDYVVRHHRRGRPAVVNISLGGPASRVADRAVNRVIDDGVTVVTAAGNANTSACTTSPARVPRVITVSAVNSNDWAPGWANNGRCVDLYAPGIDIRSAGTASVTATRTISGTSMAAPHVAGAAARYLSVHRSASPASVARHLRDTATRRARNVGANTTTKLLYVRGRVPTALANGMSRGWVDPDDYLVVRTRLRNRVTDAGLAGRSVQLWARRSGSSAWEKLVVRRTDSQGWAAFTYQPRRRTEYQWRHVGTARTLPSRSAVREVTLRRWDTYLGWVYGPGLHGFFNTLDGYPLRGYSIHLYARPDVGGDWTYVAQQTTDESGDVNFSPFYAPATQYMMRHTGSAKTKPAVSGVYPDP